MSSKPPVQIKDVNLEIKEQKFQMETKPSIEAINLKHCWQDIINYSKTSDLGFTIRQLILETPSIELSKTAVTLAKHWMNCVYQSPITKPIVEPWNGQLGFGQHRWHLDVRCWFWLTALRKQCRSYRFLTELKVIATHSLSKTALLELFPEFQRPIDNLEPNVLEKFMPNTLSLLDAVAAMVANKLTTMEFAFDMINVLLEQKLDTQSTMIMLLQLPNFPTSFLGERLLEQLMPNVQSQHMNVFWALLDSFSPRLLTQFVKDPNGQWSKWGMLVLARLAEEYRSGTLTVFHRLCNIKSFALADKAISMMKVLGSEKHIHTKEGGKIIKTEKTNHPPTPFEKIETKEIQVDTLNVKDIFGRVPLDYASLWADRNHVDALTALGMTACDDLTALFRFQAGKLARTFARPANISSTLFPSRSGDMLKALKDAQLLHATHRKRGSYLSARWGTEGNFSKTLPVTLDSGQTLSVRRLYSTSAPVTNAALRIAALGNHPGLADAVIRVLALDSDAQNHLLMGTELMSEGSLKNCLYAGNESPFAIQLRKRRDPDSVVLRLKVAVQAAHALKIIHEHHLIHGDVHPGHILIQWDPNHHSVICKFGGFDLSPSLHDTPSHIRLELWSPWTANNNAFAPELIPSSTSNHVNNYTQLSDVYGLGMVLRWLFFYDLKNASEVADLEYIIQAACESEPKNRATAAQVHALLQMVLATRDPADDRDPETILFTLTDSSGKDHTLNKKNWPLQYNTVTLPGTIVTLGDKARLHAETQKQNEVTPRLHIELPKKTNTKDSLFYQVPKRTWPLMGREREYKMMADTLKQQGIVAVLGQSGMGKTALVTEFCNLNRAQYENIVWMNEIANTNSTLTSQVHLFLKRENPKLIPEREKLAADATQAAQIAAENKRRLGLYQGLIQWLKGAKPSLLVLDDVAVANIKDWRHLLNGSGVHCIVISKATSTPFDWKEYFSVELKSLEMQWGPRFFDSTEGRSAPVLSSVLAFGPLCLTLSAAYSHHCRQTTDAFLAFLQLQMKASGSRDYVTSCLDFLVQQVPLLDKSQTATDLLSFLSVLAPTQIPMKWFGLFLKDLRKSSDEAIKTAAALLKSLKLLSIDNDQHGNLDLENGLCSVHFTVALHAIRDQIIRKDAARIARAAFIVLEKLWNDAKTEEERLMLLPHLAVFADQAAVSSIANIKEFFGKVAQYTATVLGDAILASYFKSKWEASAPVGTAVAQLMADMPTPPPNRLKIPDYSSDIWAKAARFNGQYTDYKPDPNKRDTITIPVASNGLPFVTIDPSLDKYLRNLRSHYAPLPVRTEQWAVFERMIREFLQGGFLVTSSSHERAAEANRRRIEWETEFKQSKQHTAFHLTTHAHSHLIRILAKLANFFTAHFRQHPEFEQGIKQLLDFADAFGPSGNKLFDAFAKHEYGEREIIFCFRRFDGTLHTNNYRAHPPGSDKHTGLFSFTITGVLLSREEMEMAMDDPLLKQGAQTGPSQLLTTDPSTNKHTNTNTSTQKSKVEDKKINADKGYENNFLGCAVARLMTQFGFIDDQFTCIQDQKAGKEVRDATAKTACVNCASKTWGAHSIHVQEVVTFYEDVEEEDVEESEVSKFNPDRFEDKASEDFYHIPFFENHLLLWYHPQARLASPYKTVANPLVGLYPNDGYVTLQWCTTHNKMCVAKPITLKDAPCKMGASADSKQFQADSRQSQPAKTTTFNSDHHQPTTIMQLSAAASNVVGEARAAAQEKNERRKKQLEQHSAPVANDPNSTQSQQQYLGCSVSRMMQHLGYRDDQFTCTIDIQAGKNVPAAKGRNKACDRCASMTWGVYADCVQEVPKDVIDPKVTYEGFHQTLFFKNRLVLWHSFELRNRSPYKNADNPHPEYYPKDGYLSLTWCHEHKRMCANNLAKKTTKSGKQVVKPLPGHKKKNGN